VAEPSVADPSVTDPVRRVEAAPGVVRLVLDRPGSYNALSREMLDALLAALTAIAGDASCRVVILSGAGRGFSAGHDLAEMSARQRDVPWQEELFAVCSRVMTAIGELPQPVIAQVHGVATAAGLQLAASCDLVVAAEEARFALPGVSVGIFCSTPAVAVGRRIGRSRTMELLLTGTPVGAATALSWGLANRVVPAAELDSAAEELAASIAGRSAAVVGRGKRAFYAQMDADVAGAYASASAAMVCDVSSPDAAEGMAAFLEKRAPVWP
jgi:enoyl-CoA hydratase/carnithine racemase